MLKWILKYILQCNLIQFLVVGFYDLIFKKIKHLTILYNVYRNID